ncbi:MAG: Rpn family recombination-promoting nuclease/putative transposase [Bacteroidia bacterium]|nr:Rpn family recombination-promoting nuclease/putative transposase [Bacteroidia bacterium]
MGVTRNLIRFDWALKRLLRNKANFAVLEGFLSELLKRDITIFEIAESEGNKESYDDKFNRVDILARTTGNEIIIVELQVEDELDYFHRILYGVSKALTERIKEGEKYGAIKKIYSVSIVYFELGQGEDYVYHGINEFHGIHKNDILKLSAEQKETYTKEQVYEIFPEYYILKVNSFDDVAKDTLDEWIYFLKNNEIPDTFKAKGLDVAKKVLKEDNMTNEEKAAYRHHLENVRYADSMLFSAETKGRIEGKQIGLQEGKQIGLQEGEQIGLQKNSLLIGLKAICMGMADEDIIELTGLSIQIIGKLKELFKKYGKNAKNHIKKFGIE